VGNGLAQPHYLVYEITIKREIPEKESVMSKILNVIIGLVGVWVTYLGVFNIVTSGGGSTAELQEAQLWVGIMALSIGIGLLAIFLRLIRR
jgi:predicted benzoate:H+ symporter BenE